jgi:diguanylate cyclase (GGDEF)-like protein
MLRKKLKYDALTGLRNSQNFEERVLSRMKESARVKQDKRESHIGGDATLVFMDVDNFKKMNDKHGHLKGDMVLQILANIIRDEDLVVRRSGDEFLVVLFGLNKAQAGERLVEIRGQFEAAAREAFPELEFPMSFSFGMGKLPPSADKMVFEAALNTAEKNMQVHKKERGMGR